MQTLHLRFRDLRAISLGKSPSRWRTRSMHPASTWKGASPLPNLPRPTLAVGLPAETSRPQPDQAPLGRGGLLLAGAFRAPRICGAGGPDARRVCPGQTACDLARYPARQEAGDIEPSHRQALPSEARWAASDGRPYLRRPRWCHWAPCYGVQAGRNMTVSQKRSGSGTSCSETADTHPRGKSVSCTLRRKKAGKGLLPSCTGMPCFVTRQSRIAPAPGAGDYRRPRGG